MVIQQTKPCECGCGGIILTPDRSGRLVRFKKGHQTKGKKCPEIAVRMRGSNNHSWKGGIRQHSQGYIEIYMPDHPHTQTTGYVLEHRLVMEKKLGRYLEDYEIVHHKNGKRNDNRIDNLKLVIAGIHTRIHHYKRPLGTNEIAAFKRLFYWLFPLEVRMLHYHCMHKSRPL